MICRLAKCAINGTFWRSSDFTDYLMCLQSLPFSLLFIPLKKRKGRILATSPLLRDPFPHFVQFYYTGFNFYEKLSFTDIIPPFIAGRS